MAQTANRIPTPLITSDPDRLGGIPCFTGTRIPVRTLFDHLSAGDPLEVFLEDFPDVSSDHAVAVLRSANAALVLASIEAGPYVPTTDERAAIDEAEVQLARGERVPKADIDAFWRRHGL